TPPSTSAYFQQQDVLLGRVFLVVLVAGIHQELAAGKALRPVTLLTGLARRAEMLYRRRNGARISVERYREDLAQTGKLRAHKPRCSRPDVARDTVHPRVGRILIGRKLGIHHGV